MRLVFFRFFIPVFALEFESIEEVEFMREGTDEDLGVSNDVDSREEQEDEEEEEDEDEDPEAESGTNHVCSHLRRLEQIRCSSKVVKLTGANA